MKPSEKILKRTKEISKKLAFDVEEVLSPIGQALLEFLDDTFPSLSQPKNVFCDYCKEVLDGGPATGGHGYHNDCKKKHEDEGKGEKR